MTTFQPSEIIEEFKNFIRTSCAPSEDDNQFSSLHKGIIKIYFSARKVEIDYEKKIIKAEIPVSDNQYTIVNFECQDMEKFLSSCVKTDKRSLNYYRNTLNYYNYIPGNLSQVA